MTGFPTILLVASAGLLGFPGIFGIGFDRNKYNRCKNLRVRIMGNDRNNNRCLNRETPK
jgi:hypothetical protein